MKKSVMCAGLLAMVVAAGSMPASAQGLFDVLKGVAGDASVYTPPQEITLTEDIVKRYAAVVKERTGMTGSLSQDGKPPTVAQIMRSSAERESVALKHGFKLDREFQNVEFTVMPIVAAIHPQTGVYTDPKTRNEQQIADTVKSPHFSADEKAEIIASLRESIAMQKPYKPENVALVLKYLKDLRGF
jgi:hypothetical protein